MTITSSQVAVVISFELDGTMQSVVLDTVQDVSVDSNATVNTQPVVSGDLIADHMYRNPRTIRINGDFSLNGSTNPTSWSIKDDEGNTSTYKGILVTGGGVNLANVQTIFERLQTEGIQCRIFKISTRDGQVRFLQRDNMVLQSITWTEKINSMAFSFSFVEAITVEVVTTKADVSDQFLPNINEVESSNFTDTLIDWNQVDQSFIRTLFDFDLIQQAFWDFISSNTANQLVALGVAAGTAVLVATICGSLAAAGPVGWAIIAVAAVAMAAYGLFKLFKRFYEQSKYVIQQFKYYKDAAKQAKEADRFSDVVAGVHNELAELNNLIHVYKVATEGPQECLVNIDGQYYCFAFTKNNTQLTFDCEVTDLNNNRVGGCSNVFSAPSSYNDCASWDPLFRTENNHYYIYLVNVGEEKKLTDVMIVVSQINPQDYNDALIDILKASLLT